VGAGAGSGAGVRTIEETGADAGAGAGAGADVGAEVDVDVGAGSGVGAAGSGTRTIMGAGAGVHGADGGTGGGWHPAKESDARVVAAVGRGGGGGAEAVGAAGGVGGSTETGAAAVASDIVSRNERAARYATVWHSVTQCKELRANTEWSDAQPTCVGVASGGVETKPENSHVTQRQSTLKALGLPSEKTKPAFHHMYVHIPNTFVRGTSSSGKLCNSVVHCDSWEREREASETKKRCCVCS